MTDAQARSVVAGVALIAAALIAALAWGRAAVDIVLVVGFLWLLWDRGTLYERVDVTDDRSDLALGKVEAVEHHLSGLEPEGAGRHARRKAA